MSIPVAPNKRFQEAARTGDADKVKQLLPISDPTEDFSYVIRAAAGNGHLHTLKVLLEDGRANPADWDNQAIRWAAEYGHYECVDLLLKDVRVDPTAKDNYALRMAEKNGHLAVVMTLLADDRFSLWGEITSD